MSAEEKKPYEDEAKAALEKWNGDLTQFKQGEDYQKFQKAIKVRKTIVKKKKGKPVKKVVAGPVPPNRPDSMPKKPSRDAVSMFGTQFPGLTRSALSEKWTNLTPEERAKYQEDLKAQQEKYEEELGDWNKTEDGKRYNKEVKVYQKRKATLDAKKRYLSNVSEPKKASASGRLLLRRKKGRHPESPS